MPSQGRLRFLGAVLVLGLVAGACVTARSDGQGQASPSAEPSAATPAASALIAPGASPAVGASEPAISPSPGPYRSAELSIGYISLDGSQAFAQAVSTGIRAAAEGAGVDLVECDSGWTREGVSRCASELSEAGVHGVISFQPFADLAADVCVAIGDAPTVGIVYDQGPCQVSLLSIDQTEAGRLGGRALGQLASERWGCQVRALIGLASGEGDPIGGARMDGYREGYEEHCELPLETRALPDAQHLVTAKTQLARVLEEIKGQPILVAGVSDSAVLGAMTAASDQRRAKHVWYAGQLAEPEIRGVIACGEHVVGSVGQFPERFGATVVPTLLDAIEGREVPAELDAELELVTSANVRQLFPDTPACDE